MREETLHSKSKKIAISKFAIYIGVACIYPCVCISKLSPSSFSFGGTCEAYQGGSTLCNGELAESVDIYFINARSVNTQAQLTSQLNGIISPVFTIASTHCQKLIKKYFVSTTTHPVVSMEHCISSFHLP